MTSTGGRLARFLKWKVFCPSPVMSAVRRRRTMTKLPFLKDADNQANSSFVEDGFVRAWDAVEAEVRSEVEEKYAKEWNALGIIKRWRVQRQMEREISERVDERLKHISDYSLF